LRPSRGRRARAPPKSAELVHARLPTLPILAGVCMAGCATLHREANVEQVQIAESVTLRLPKAEDLVDSLDATQIVTGTYGERRYSMQVQLEWRPGSIVLAALNVWGTALFTISYDGRRLATEGSQTITEALRPEYVLADILLTFSSDTALRAELVGSGLELEDASGRRTFSRDGKPIIVIHYDGASPWEGTVRFEHIERGYELMIETIEVDRS
jgi:Protein of unknown function (DUF3261)